MAVEDAETTKESDATEKEGPDENDPINERKILEEYITALDSRIKLKIELRNENLNAVRPQESYFFKLESGLKKNSTFVKKLKSFSATQYDALVKDLKTLNLTKYISEVAAALSEAKLKMSDIALAVQLCSIIHRTYADFSQSFFENWQKQLTFKINDKITNSSKLRVDIRFYAELILAGIFSNKVGLPLLGNLLTVLINMDKEEHNNIPILLSFCKHCGEDYAGLAPKKIQELSAKYETPLPRNPFLPPEKQNSVRALLKDYFASLTKHLLSEKQQLTMLHLANQRTLHTRGELSQERKEQLEQHQAVYDKLLAGAQNLAEILGEALGEAGEPPTLNLTSVLEPTGSTAQDGTDEAALPSGADPWQDEDTKTFYTSLPDLKVFMPNYQHKETKPKAEETVTEEMLDEELKDEDLSDVEEPAATVTESIEPEEPVTTTNVSSKYAFEAFINHLPNCINRELIDTAAVDFVLNFNTKHNRKKITRILFGVARTRLDLLPFYARFATILYPVLPDICTDLCQMLKQDFKYHVRKKDQINIESKIKVVRFIGELVKFGMYSKIEGLYCLKVLLHDFKHHHIEMACNLWETCGRFLYCNPDTHQRTLIYLQQMMRKKTVSALDSRYVTQIENAYYYVCPPDLPTKPNAHEPPMHRFIRKILHEDLQKSNEEKILRLIRKLDWDDPEIMDVAVEALASGWRVRSSSRRVLARLIAELSAWQETAAPMAVDYVLEEIQATLEDPQPSFNQRRLATVRFLGELYNYKLLDSRDIFNVLYSFITYGVTMDHNEPSPLDPPDNVFRIKLVCALLETCGAYFNGGSGKKRLDYFLLFFQNYYWFKFENPCWTEDNPFPIYAKFIFQECLTILRPKLVPFTSWDECKAAVEDLRETLYPLLSEEGGEVKGEFANDIPLNATHDEMESEDDTDADVGGGTTGIGGEGDECHSDEEETRGPEDNCWEGREGRESPPPDRIRSLRAPEDEEFEAALERMVAENLAARGRDTRVPSRDIPLPTTRTNAKKSYEQLNQDGKEGVEFVLMVRKGTKQQYKSFNAPPELANNLQQRALANRQEMEKVKRLTLNISERQEEEEYGNETSGGNSGGNPNRDRHSRQKYQHPKGAPDVDLIFGPKKFK